MIQRLILALLIVVTGMLAFAMWRVEINRSPNLPEILDGLRSDKVNLTIQNEWGQDVTFTTSWKDTNGVEWSVTTTQKAEESYEDFKKRHLDAVFDLQVQHPPV